MQTDSQNTYDKKNAFIFYSLAQVNVKTNNKNIKTHIEIKRTI